MGNRQQMVEISQFSACETSSLSIRPKSKDGKPQQAQQRPNDAQDYGNYPPDCIRVRAPHRGRCGRRLDLGQVDGLGGCDHRRSGRAALATKDILFKQNGAAVVTLDGEGHLGSFSMGSEPDGRPC